MKGAVMSQRWKFQWLVLLAMLLTLHLGGCSDAGYTPYIPIVLSDLTGRQGLVEDKTLLTPEHISAVQVVLNEYNQPYKMIDGELYIKPSLWRDRDLLWNFTSKAEGVRERTLEAKRLKEKASSDEHREDSDVSEQP